MLFCKQEQRIKVNSTHLSNSHTSAPTLLCAVTSLPSPWEGCGTQNALTELQVLSEATEPCPCAQLQEHTLQRSCAGTGIILLETLRLPLSLEHTIQHAGRTQQLSPQHAGSPHQPTAPPLSLSGAKTHTAEAALRAVQPTDLETRSQTKVRQKMSEKNTYFFCVKSAYDTVLSPPPFPSETKRQKMLPSSSGNNLTSKVLSTCWQTPIRSVSPFRNGSTAGRDP